MRFRKLDNVALLWGIADVLRLAIYVVQELRVGRVPIVDSLLEARATAELMESSLPEFIAVLGAVLFVSLTLRQSEDYAAIRRQLATKPVEQLDSGSLPRDVRVGEPRKKEDVVWIPGEIGDGDIPTVKRCIDSSPGEKLAPTLDGSR